eukprot:760712-Hanusia_phi.AAC.2
MGSLHAFKGEDSSSSFRPPLEAAAVVKEEEAEAQDTELPHVFVGEATFAAREEAGGEKKEDDEDMRCCYAGMNIFQDHGTFLEEPGTSPLRDPSSPLTLAMPPLPSCLFVASSS